jgi:hypothetical protein
MRAVKPFLSWTTPRDVDKRFENSSRAKIDEKMNRDVRSGGTFIETWWSFEADQDLQKLKPGSMRHRKQ